MVTSKKSSEVLEDSIQKLEATTELVEHLLEDILGSAADFSSIKTELRILVEHVKELTSSLKDSHLDIANLKIKIALLEKSISEIEAWMKLRQHQEDTHSLSLKVADKTGRWQVVTGMVTGSIALITAIITIILTLVSK